MKKYLVIGAMLICSLMFLPLLFFGSTDVAGAAGTSTVNGVTVPNRTRVPAVTQSAEQIAFIQKMAAFSATAKANGIYPSVMIAQAALESEWGRSKLAAKSNNYFGVKATSSWHGPTIDMLTGENYDGVNVTINARWKVFSSIEEGVIDYCNFCHGRTYIEAGLLTATNYYEQITALRNGGYATDPDYIDKVCRIVEQNNLDQYDK